MNSVTFVGRLTKDPVMKTLNDGKVVTTFSIAVQRTKEVADFFNIETWSKTAESVAEYVTKGSIVGVKGSMINDTFEVDGVKRTASKVIADKVTFILLKSTDSE